MKQEFTVKILFSVLNRTTQVILKRLVPSFTLYLFLVLFAINGNAQTGKKAPAGNLSLGDSALANNTTGLNNTAIGYFSLYSNTTGSYNTALGYQALYSNTTGITNTAFGRNALESNTTGFGNTAVGYGAMEATTTAIKNSGFGRGALHFNTTGDDNAASGFYALNHNTTGSANSANGFRALYKNRTGRRNTGTGTDALYSNLTGSYNVASGESSLAHNKSGSDNSAFGTEALYSNKYGNENTAIGNYADVKHDSLENATAIGYEAIVDASDKVRIGNTEITSIGGQVGWTTFSDGRFKKDIKDNVPGLVFINSLKPVTYTVNLKGLKEYYKSGGQVFDDLDMNDEEDKDFAAAALHKQRTERKGTVNDKILYNGFIAQDVEEAAKKINYDFSGVDKPQRKDGLYGLRYDNFVAPLVKAVQELSIMNNDKNAKIDEMQNEIDDLKAALQLLANKNGVNVNLAKAAGTSASLEQNVPNPSAQSTSIRYTLPSKFSSAQIIVTDNSGKTIKKMSLSGSGKGMFQLDTATFAAGSYNYSLIIDGKVIGTKQMILSK